jgi:hypothetical protein
MPDGKPFCHVYGADGGAVVYATLREPKEVTANARLIAAAPEFAEAARRAVTGNAFMDAGDFVAIPREAYEAFHSLLARIEGGDSALAAWIEEAGE